jgi:hypothetical protein
MVFVVYVRHADGTIISESRFWDRADAERQRAIVAAQYEGIYGPSSRYSVRIREEVQRGR